MGDVWPFGPPDIASWDDTVNAAHGAGFSSDGAIVMAAIATAESSRDLHVVNDTASTGDYSVGAWQINYYGSLRAGRVKEFGTPGHLARSGVNGQAHAAYVVWQQQGFDAWSTYKSGEYKQYLKGGQGTIGAPASPFVPIPPPTNVGKDSWDGQVTRAADAMQKTNESLHNYATAINRLRS